MEHYIRLIQSEFISGKRVVELQAKNPRAFRKLLYKAARRRGLWWSFSTLEGSVFVMRSL